MVNLLLPRFRWGTVPASPGRGIRRGPSYQFYRLVPNDVIEIIAGHPLDAGLEENNIDRAVANYWQSVDQLVEERVDVIVVSSAPITSAMGRARVLELLKETEQKTGIRTISVLECIVAGFKHLGVTRVAMASIWEARLNGIVSRYLKDGGLDVAAVTTRPQQGWHATPVTLEGGMELSLEVGREALQLAGNGEGLYIAGGTMMSLHSVPTIESESGVSVITNLTGEVWSALVQPGVIPPIKGWGKLLSSP